ncbi:MAG: hypothetical protein QP798_10360 [Staphylococcus simulans]|uniref:hypothetical protein n=1 Tax=Staphylococcus TaxID=1279 RepID=UPI0008A8D3F9|nr:MULTISPECIES: hypothetical protein [Staphylococcus]MDK7927671.1 hypothetical protein [Staphylococcus simulans]MDK8316337.1 hypothetical protein [Staphylococcus simulans]OHR51784.1 hypothetical protein HMPREF2951_08410 [Staphylococcus sp. HMSC056D08]OHS50380.1 hypothetical protein HMPREF3270_08865 [Staphylococcus sp. HMSC65H10]
MTNEDAIKVLELQREHTRLLGQIEAYNSTLSKIEETRELFNGLFDEKEDKGVYAGIAVVENKVIAECQQAIKNIKEISKEIDKLAGIETDDTVTDLEEWKMLNQ